MANSTRHAPAVDIARIAFSEAPLKKATCASPPQSYPGDKAIKHTMIDVESGPLHVAEIGNGYPLVLLHGWPEFWFTWEPVMLLLSKHFRFLAPDLRGFGDSSKPDGPYTSQQHAQDIVGLLAALDLPKVGLVSHDVGGAVAQALAHEYKDRFSGLFFFNFLHPGVGDRFFSLDRFINVWYMFFQQAPFAVDLVSATPESIERYFSFFLRDWAHRKTCFDAVMHIFTDNFSKPGNVAGGFDYYRAAMPPRTNPVGGRLPSPPPPILLPTCVRWSQHDKLFDYAWTDTLPTYFPNLDLAQFPDVGHFPHREDPERAAAYIAAFFTQLQAGH